MTIVFSDAVSNLYHVISGHNHHLHNLNNYWVIAYNIKMLSKTQEVTLVKVF